jgi:hypothetical protein
VPNGTYDVHLVAGDAGFTDSQHVYNREGHPALSGTPTSAAPWVESIVRVSMSDGRLTLSNDPAGSNQKIDYIDVNTADVTPPTVQSAAFHYNVAPHALSFVFSEDVGASLGAGDVTLQNLTTGQTIPGAELALSYNSATNTATLTKTGPPVLPDGAYRATVHAGGVKDAADNALAADFTYDFFMLAGDANHDRTVDLTDFTILAANFNQTGKSFSQGDFNYDGTVDLTDFTYLAANFDRTLPGAMS